MKRPQLIAIARSHRDLPPGMRSVAVDGLAAIFAVLPRAVHLTRRGMLRAAAQRQACLEALLPLRAVLPVLPGQDIPPADVERMLRANAPTLCRKLEDVAGKAQYQIALSMDEGTAMARLTHGEGPYRAARDLPDLRTRLAAEFEDRLRAATVDAVMLPLADTLVANAVVLVDDRSDAALHEAVADIDAIWPEGFRLRVIGPSPAVSFASIRFVKTEAREVAQALDMLRLRSVNGEAEIAAARKTALREGLHAPEQVRLAADIAMCAGRLHDGGAAPFHRVTFWAEGMAAAAPDRLREAA